MKTEIVEPKTLFIVDVGRPALKDVWGGDGKDVWIASFHSQAAAKNFITWSNHHLKSWEGEKLGSLEPEPEPLPT